MSTDKNATTTVLSRAALAGAHLTAKDDTRPALNSVWTRGDRVEAADGFIASTVKLKDALPENIRISRDDALAALRKTTRARRALQLHVDEDGATITTEAKPGEALTIEPLDDGVTCPDVAGLTARRVPQAAVVLSLDLMKQMVSFFDAALGVSDRNASYPIEMRVFGLNHGVEYRAISPEGDEATVIQMPMVITPQGQWIFDGVDGVPRDELTDHHIREAIIAGRAGEAAAAVEQVRRDRDDEREPGPCEGAWERVGSPGEIAVEDRKANTHEALALLGYADEQIAEALKALDSAPVASAAD